MPEDFYIRPGRYVVPNHGVVNTKLPISDNDKVALYLNKKFPFITLQPGGVKLLKKAKLSNEQLTVLIRHSKSADEVDMVLKVRSNKVLRRIADFTKAKFKT